MTSQHFSAHSAFSIFEFVIDDLFQLCPGNVTDNASPVHKRRRSGIHAERATFGLRARHFRLGRFILHASSQLNGLEWLRFSPFGQLVFQILEVISACLSKIQSWYSQNSCRLLAEDTTPRNGSGFGPRMYRLQGIVFENNAHLVGKVDATFCRRIFASS